MVLQRRADRAAEVAERGDLDRGRVVVVEQVRVHRLDDSLRVGLSQPGAEPAADDHRLDVEQVDRRGDPGAECPDGAVDQLRRQRVLGLQSPLPDPAGQPVVLVLLHDLEQVGLAAVLVLGSRLGLHRRPARIGLDASAPPAGALRAALLDHHVSDLAGTAAPQPRLAVEDQPAADPGAPEDSDERLVGTSGAELELGLGCHLHVVADLDRGAELLCEPRPELERRRPSRAGSVPGKRSRCARSRRRASRHRRRPGRWSRGSPPRAASRIASAICSATSEGPPLVGVGRRACPEHLPPAVDDDGLDLGAAEVDAAAGNHALMLLAAQDRDNAESGRWWSCRGRARARHRPAARGRSASPGPCRARLPTGRRSRCPRSRPG